MGRIFIGRAFAIVVLGGLGSFVGAFIGALVLGVMEVTAYFTDTHRRGGFLRGAGPRPPTAPVQVVWGERPSELAAPGAVAVIEYPRDTDIGGPTAPIKPRRVQRATGAGLPAWGGIAKIYLLLLLIAVGALLFFPLVTSAYNITLALTVLLTVVMATSWNIISGSRATFPSVMPAFSVSAPMSAPC